MSALDDEIMQTKRLVSLANDVRRKYAEINKLQTDKQKSKNTCNLF